MQEAGIILSELENEGKKESAAAEKPAGKGAKASASVSQQDLGEFSRDELDKMLEDAIDVENYILAAKIRDEIKKRE